MSHTHDAARDEKQAAETQQTERQDQPQAEETVNPAEDAEGAAQPSDHADTTDRAGEQEEKETADPAEQADEQAEARDREALENELQRLQALADENQQRYLRTQADFDNYRKRTQREKEEFAQYASMSLVEKLLPVLDNFERALAATGSSKDQEALHKGLEMIYRQFFQVLEQEGLKPIPAVGEPFNPEVHQAVMQVESEEHEEGIVVEEMQKGYFLKDKVLRPSMVKVSS